MSDYRVAIIVGSLRKESLNLKLARALAKLGGAKFESRFLSIDLPLYNQDVEDKGLPKQVEEFKTGISAAHSRPHRHAGI